jgi:hypothetical protein
MCARGVKFLKLTSKTTPMRRFQLYLKFIYQKHSFRMGQKHSAPLCKSDRGIIPLATVLVPYTYTYT